MDVAKGGGNGGLGMHGDSLTPTTPASAAAHSTGQALLEALPADLDALPVGLLAVDTAGIVSSANVLARVLLGSDALEGRACPVPVTADETTTVEVSAADGARVLEVRAGPMAADGQRLVTLADVTARTRAAQESRLLRELSVAIAEADDVTAALQITLWRLSIDGGWHAAEMWGLDEEGAHLELEARWCGGSIEQAVLDRGPHRLELDGPGLVAQAWATRAPLWRAGLGPADGAAAAAGLRCGTAVPLTAGEEVLGVVAFYAAHPPHAEQQRHHTVVAAVLAQLGGLLMRKRVEAVLTDFARELATRNRDLTRVNADLERMATIASHDLRQPLTVLRGNLATIARLGDRDEPALVRELVATSLRTCDRMSQLIEDCLAYARTGATSPRVEAVALGRAVERAAALLGDSAPRLRVEVGPLPIVTADPTLLDMVFTNLLANAAKYVAAGVEPAVVVRATFEPGFWRIDVIDNGLGVPLEDTDAIFEMFTRRHAEHAPGSGVGLAICRRAVERMGGRIWVEEVPGGGSCFAFTLPTSG